VEYQMALLSADPGCAAVEFIYVLDDPPKRREAQYIFTAVYERTQVAFRTLLLDCNMGFAPACNIGLQRARAPIVAFLNSDVFPGTPDWLARLGERLAADPQLGIVAPWLLFEDGSVQHRGMTFGRLPEFANWHFGQHIGKGQHAPIRPARSGVQRCLSLTGACMVMARALAEQVGGFDEVYAVGDFEDSDMCFNVARLGYACAVDPEVRLYHLERQSQAGDGSHWRQNLTVYNAWQHERRWGKQIAELQEAARTR
jgi:GT2 family glycosyltransferase